MASNANQLPWDLLQQVSRSFYKTLRILPTPIRPQVSLAYLLARTTDTVADTELVPVHARLNALALLRDRIAGATDARAGFGDLARQQGSPAERVLLEQTEQVLALLPTLALEDLRLVREVLGTIISGQELDLRRFDTASSTHIIALKTDADLDDYTYRVAGCVGEFWTKIARFKLFPDDPLNDAALLADGIRFGKGLQLVNILRDIPADLRKGRCYLPEEKLQAAGLKPTDLLDPANEPRLRTLYRSYLDLASSHLAAGWAYTNALPRRCIRIRLACAWPILIGLETIVLLRAGNVLNHSQRIKIDRAKIKRLILRSIILYPWAKAWTGMVHATP